MKRHQPQRKSTPVRGAAGVAAEPLVRVRHKKHRKIPRAAFVSLGVVVAVVVGVCAAAAAWIGSLNASMGFDNPVEKEKLISRLAPASTGVAEGESNAFYLLILGSDARGDEVSRSDVNMLVRVDPSAAQVTLVSVPRDTMISIEGQGTQKINAAYAFDGPAGAVDAISTFAGVPISHYAEVHFEELERLIDLLDGIWVDVPEEFTSDSGISFSKGHQRMSGEQALAFARERHHVSGGDFGRAQAQRIIVQAVIDRVLSASPLDMAGYIGEIANCLTTDLSVQDALDLAQQFREAGAPTMYSTICPSYSREVEGVSYVCPMFDEWRMLMQRVDAGLDPNDEAAIVPEAQQNNPELGAASNSPAPRDYEAYASAAGLTTDDVASKEDEQ